MCQWEGTVSLWVRGREDEEVKERCGLEDQVKKSTSPGIGSVSKLATASERTGTGRVVAKEMNLKPGNWDRVFGEIDADKLVALQESRGLLWRWTW